MAKKRERKALERTRSGLNSWSLTRAWLFWKTLSKLDRMFLTFLTKLEPPLISLPFVTRATSQVLFDKSVMSIPPRASAAADYKCLPDFCLCSPYRVPGTESSGDTEGDWLDSPFMTTTSVAHLLTKQIWEINKKKQPTVTLTCPLHTTAH